MGRFTLDWRYSKACLIVFTQPVGGKNSWGIAETAQAATRQDYCWQPMGMHRNTRLRIHGNVWKQESAVYRLSEEHRHLFHRTRYARLTVPFQILLIIPHCARK